MTACVNCARALQPAWKYCIFCGTRTAVAATAPRSRPLPAPASGPASGGPRRASAPARTSVPAFSGSGTAQTPIVPVGAPAPLAAAPVVPPLSSEWPETMGDRPSLRSALAGTEVPAPTPPAAPVPAPEDDEAFEPEAAEEPEAQPEPEAEAEPEAVAEPEPAPRRPRGPRRRPGAAIATIVEEAPAEVAPVAPAPVESAPSGPAPAKKTAAKKKALQVFPDEEPIELEPDADDVETRVDRTGRVNLLAVLALLLGVLASPLAALFGHVALGQLRASGERGVIPAWIAIVLGYLWLGFFLVLGITYLATNG
jgi:hypothetical protein